MKDLVLSRLGINPPKINKVLDFGNDKKFCSLFSKKIAFEIAKEIFSKGFMISFNLNPFVLCAKSEGPKSVPFLGFVGSVIHCQLSLGNLPNMARAYPSSLVNQVLSFSSPLKFE